MDELALQSDADREQGEHRIVGLESEFADALARIELASQQIEALMQTDAGELTLRRGAGRVLTEPSHV